MNNVVTKLADLCGDFISNRPICRSVPEVGVLGRTTGYNYQTADRRPAVLNTFIGNTIVAPT